MIEYQKVINFLDSTPNQPSKSNTKNWVEINDSLRGTYNTNNKIKFKATTLKLILCDYSDTYILVKETTSVTNIAAAKKLQMRLQKKSNIKVILKNCLPFTNCLSDINNTLADNAKDDDLV